jgi:hypothetical protein
MYEYIDYNLWYGMRKEDMSISQWNCSKNGGGVENPAVYDIMPKVGVEPT